MTSTTSRPSRRRSRRAVGRQPVNAVVTEDQQGLITEQLRTPADAGAPKEEFHDGSVHHMVVNHKGKVLVDEEFER